MRSYQQMIYAHVLTLQGNYREALTIFEAGISPAGNEISVIARYIAILGKMMVLLNKGQLGEVLRITRAETELAEKNGGATWMFDFREAWVRTLAFDFEGARQICKSICEPRSMYLAGQMHTIDRMAAGYIALDRREHDQAIEHFRQVRDPEITPKYFLHWIWLRMAELESSNAWLRSGNVLKARTEADGFLASALSTADPHLQALAWDLKTRVAMAEKDWTAAKDHIQQSLAIVEKFEVLVAAWQAHATAWELYRHLKEHKKAETSRERAEACILKIANSFAPDEPLRATFLAAAPVRRILGESTLKKPTRPRESRHRAAF
jgi:tetratricopeptide (TPR) repeat protein